MFGFLPNIVVVFLAMALVANVLLNHTRFGKNLFAVGGNVDAARASGINVERTLIAAYCWSSFCAALAGVMGHVAQRQRHRLPRRRLRAGRHRGGYGRRCVADRRRRFHHRLHRRYSRSRRHQQRPSDHGRFAVPAEDHQGALSSWSPWCSICAKSPARDKSEIPKWTARTLPPLPSGRLLLRSRLQPPLCGRLQTVVTRS